VYWRALDDWSNTSALRLVKFRVLPAAAAATCSVPRSVSEISDVSL